MKKVVFLTGLVVMTSNVWSMNPSEQRSDTRFAMSLSEMRNHLSEQNLSVEEVCEYINEEDESYYIDRLSEEKNKSFLLQQKN